LGIIFIPYIAVNSSMLRFCIESPPTSLNINSDSLRYGKSPSKIIFISAF